MFKYIDVFANKTDRDDDAGAIIFIFFFILFSSADYLNYLQHFSLSAEDYPHTFRRPQHFTNTPDISTVPIQKCIWIFQHKLCDTAVIPCNRRRYIINKIQN